uniref:Very long-chain specific acyl-CoA dehydrogenase, mitochondrial n=1 Tax=Heterorhabditis bacteriophora TaxID=37862 RepID=A0A1I7WRI3_HETBA
MLIFNVLPQVFKLHGYFEYIRRDLLISHVHPQDELQLVLNLTVTFDTVTRTSQAPKPLGLPEPKTSEVVLSARSPVFAAMLEPHTEEAQGSRVVVEDIDYDVMHELLLYLYSGRSPNIQQMGLDLLAAADRFQLPGLKEMADQVLRSSLLVDTACRYLVFADMYNSPELKNEAVKFIAQNITSIIQTDSWQELTRDHGCLVTEIVAHIANERKPCLGNISSILGPSPNITDLRSLLTSALKGLASSGVTNCNITRSNIRCAQFVSTPPPPNTEVKDLDSKSFCMNLFRGKAVTEQVFPYPLNLDSDRKETLSMILGPTEKFLDEVNDVNKNDEKAEIPREVLEKFAELGAFGAVVPVEYEGAGMNNSQMARLAEVVGAHDLGLGVVMGAHQSIGYKGVLLFGSDAQKAKYLPDLATGRKFAAFCLTESSSGSDANSIRCRAELSSDGRHYILNGGKIFISNGGIADFFTVFAQVLTSVKQADGISKDKVSAFIVERSFEGVTNGPPEKKMGIKGSSTTEVHFDNVKIPIDNLIGEEGEGFKIAMNILNNGRFGIPAACTGAMKHCIQKTVDHITHRIQFGKKLEEFGNVQEKLANMVARHYATESIVYMLAANMDKGIKDYQLEAAIGKVFASVNRQFELIRVADAAIDIYSMIAVLSRCSHSCNKKVESATHETDIAKFYVDIASRRTMDNLKQASSNCEKQINLITTIAKDVCKNGGMPLQHPIDV